MVRLKQWRQLTGRVEIDDAYLGGEVRGGKAGRGSPNKIPFVAAVQTTESGQAVLMCLSQRPCTKESIREFAESSLVAPATLVSDGLGCFTAVRDRGILHEPYVTGGGAASMKNPVFLAVNKYSATSRRRWPAPTTPSASGSTRIATSAKCSTCSIAGSICAASSDGSLGRHPRQGRARCAHFAWLIHPADQVPS